MAVLLRIYMIHLGNEYIWIWHNNYDCIRKYTLKTDIYCNFVRDMLRDVEPWGTLDTFVVIVTAKWDINANVNGNTIKNQQCPSPEDT